MGSEKVPLTLPVVDFIVISTTSVADGILAKMFPIVVTRWKLLWILWPMSISTFACVVEASIVSFLSLVVFLNSISGVGAG